MATIKPGALLWAASAALCDMEGAILPALDARTLRSFGCLDAESFAPPLAAKLAAMPNVLLANSGAGVAPAVASNGAAPKAPAAAVPWDLSAAVPLDLAVAVPFDLAVGLTFIFFGGPGRTAKDSRLDVTMISSTDLVRRHQAAQFLYRARAPPSE